MSRQISELENLLSQMIVEHRKMLEFMNAHQRAMQVCDLKSMDTLSVQQEACRLRITSLEQRRRAVVHAAARELRLTGEPTLRAIAAAVPARAAALNKLRVELKDVAEQLRRRAYVCSRVATAVLGHLNVVVKLVAGVVEKAGLYSKRGIPRVSNRIGVMDAVG